MKITNLYTYGDTKTFRIKPHTELDDLPVISNAADSNSRLEGPLQPGVYDSAKENKAYLDLVEQLGLAELSLEELAGTTIQSQINDYSIFHITPNTTRHKETILKLKIDYILRKIESYWPSQIDKCLILFKNLFLGKSYHQIAHDFWVQVSTLKSLVSDYRKLWRLYKTHLISWNGERKLKLEHYEFINQFII